MSSEVVLKFAGDTTALDKSTKHVETSMSKIGGVFESVGNKIGGEIGSLVSEVGDGFSKIGEAGGRLSTKFAAIGGAALGLGLALQAMGSADKQAQSQLKVAIENTGASWDEYESKVEAAIKGGENFGHTADQTQNALATLTTATGDPAKAFEYLTLVENLAAAQHISLDDAATKVAKTINGNTKLLKLYGIDTSKATDKTAALTDGLGQLSDKVQGQAAASVDSFSGKIGVMRAKLGDLVSSLSGPVGTGLANFGAGLATVSLIMQTRLVTNMRNANTAAVGFRGKLSALAGVLGRGAGGLAFILTAAALSFKLFSDVQAAATRRAQEYADAVKQDSGALGVATRAAVAHELVVSGLSTKVKAAGISLSTYTDAILGNQDAITTVNAQIQTYAGSMGKVIVQGGKAGSSATNLNQSIGLLTSGISVNSGALAEQVQGYKDEAAAADVSSGATDKVTTSIVKQIPALLDLYNAIESKTAAQYHAKDADQAARQAIKDLGKAHHVTAQDVRDAASKIYDAAHAAEDAGGGAAGYRGELVKLRDSVKKGSPLRKELDGFIARLDAAAKARTAQLALQIVYQTATAKGQGAHNAKVAARASGGPVAAGSTYLVGEQGMELFTPKVAGYITPHQQTPLSLTGRSRAGGSVTNYNTINTKADPNEVIRVIQKYERSNGAHWRGAA